MKEHTLYVGRMAVYNLLEFFVSMFMSLCHGQTLNSCVYDVAGLMTGMDIWVHKSF